MPADKGYNTNTLLFSADVIESFRERVKYLSTEHEMLAFVKTIHGYAKKNKLSAIEFVKDFIHQQLFRGGTKTEKRIYDSLGEEAKIIENNLINSYVNKLKSIYPGLSK